MAYSSALLPAAICAATGCGWRWAASASVVRSASAVAPSASTTSSTVSPGPARSRTSASRTPGCAVPALPMLATRLSVTASAGTPAARTVRLTARACSPATIRWSTCPALSPACLSASAIAASASGPYTCSPNRSSHTREAELPGVRHRSRNSAVAEPCPMMSASTGAPSFPPKMKAAAPSPPSRSSALPGSPVRMSDSTAIVGAADWLAVTSAPTPERTAPAMSTASASAGRRSAACTAVALVLSV